MARESRTGNLIVATTVIFAPMMHYLQRQHFEEVIRRACNESGLPSLARGLPVRQVIEETRHAQIMRLKAE